MVKAAVRRSARIEARCTPTQSELIDRAAKILGRSKTDFIVDTLQQAAMKAIKDVEMMELNAKDSLALAKALLNPIEPSNKLRDAAKRYIAAT